MEAVDVAAARALDADHAFGAATGDDFGKPVRNPLVDDDVTLVKRRSDTRVLHETQLPTTARHAVERESDRAWKRLRDRKVTDLRVEV